MNADMLSAMDRCHTQINPFDSVSYEKVLGHCRLTQGLGARSEFSRTGGGTMGYQRADTVGRETHFFRRGTKYETTEHPRTDPLCTRAGNGCAHGVRGAIPA